MKHIFVFLLIQLVVWQIAIPVWAKGFTNNTDRPGLFVENPTFTYVQTNVKCSGQTNGSFTITASGGTAPYQYSKDNGATYQTSNQFTNLGAGSYTLIVKDNLGNLSDPQPAGISEPFALYFGTSKSDVNCFGTTTGIITVTLVGGGMPPHQYSKDNGVSFNSNALFANLAAGTYQIVVKDDRGCMTSAESVVIQQPTALTASVSVTNVICNGQANGSLTITAAGGTAPYQYSKDNGASFQTSNSFSGLAAGNCSVIVKDAKGCLTTVQTATINQPAPVSFTTTKTKVLCNGESTGSITVNASGGVAPYQFSKDNGTSFQNNNMFNGLAVGNYTVIVKDANGCVSASQTIEVEQPALISFSTHKVDVSDCYGATTGMISVSIGGGGTPPYQFSKDNGASFQSIGNFANLPAGIYPIVIRDANGCTSAAQVISINQPTALSFSLSQTNVITCAGDLNGIVSVNANGGAAPYQFSKDNGTSYQTSNTFTGLAAGNYTVLIKDANNCVSSAQTVSITEPSRLNASLSATNATCYSATTGFITVNASGGTAPYQYKAFTGTYNQTQNQNTFTNLAAGLYNVSITDAHSCQTTQTVTIRQPSVLSMVVSSGDVSCNGASTGSITVNASGGTAPYQYSKDNGATFQSSNAFNGLVAGTYQILFKDANDCLTTAQSVVISQPAVISFSTRKTDVSDCYGAATGTISVSIGGGGTPPYQSSKDNGASFQSIGNFSNLPAGTYQIMLKDDRGCLSSAQSVVIEQPAALTGSLSVTNVICNGQANGSLTITVSGGTGPYQYSKDNGATYQANQQFNGLIAGQYQLVVKDSHGCTLPLSAMVSQPTGLSFTRNSTNSSCAGSADGTITLTASGGIAPYQYSINNGASFQLGNQFNSLSSGSYSTVVKDANGCTTTAQTIQISQPAVLTIASTKTDVSTCFSAANGTITITATGGTTPYQYSIDNGNTNQTSNQFLGLAAGNYSVLVKDAAGCSTPFQGVTINQPVDMSISVAKTDVTCYSANTGSLTITVTGGATPYQYSIDNGVTFLPTNGFHGLYAGNYLVVVKDANGCRATDQTITINQSTVIEARVVSVTTACPTMNNAGITYMASGGRGPYQYSLDQGAHFQTSPTFTGLAAGYYIAIVKDAAGCISNQFPMAVQASTAPTVTASVYSNVDCYGGNNGSIKIELDGGANLDMLSYSIDNGVTFIVASSPIYHLTAGNYQVVVGYGNGCRTSSQTVTIAQPAAPLSLSLIGKTDVNCEGTRTGSFTLTATGGTASYLYSNNNGDTFQTSPEFTNLGAGSYRVIVKDANGCLTSAQLITIQEPAPLTATSITTPISCQSQFTGTITITASGGTAPYQYSKDIPLSFQSSNRFTGLSAGTYPLTIKDAKGCLLTISGTISQPDRLTLSVAIMNSSCGKTNGSISLVATGGTTPYQYSKDNGVTYQASNQFSGLATGSYSVVVKDAAGCLTTAQSLSISQLSAAVSLSVVKTIDFACASSPGSLTVAASGMTSPFQYVLTNPSLSISRTQNSPEFTDLPAENTYQVFVRDAAGCESTTQTVRIDQIRPLDVSISTTNIACNGQSTGAIVIDAQYGTAPYQYSKDNGASFQSSNGFTNRNAGNYTVVVQDARLCPVTKQVTISQPDVLAFTATSTPIACAGGANGLIGMVATGGIAPYQFSKDNGVTYQASNQFSGLSTGSYSVLVKDVNGCLATAQSITITQPTPLSLSVSKTDLTNCDAKPGSITAVASGGFAPYQYSNDNGINYQSLSEFSGLTAGTYSIVSKDANACITPSQTLTFTQPGSITVTVAKTDITACSGGDDQGSLTIRALGGTGAYRYSINNGDTFQTSAQFTSLRGGSYTVVVTDGNGCHSIPQPVVITQPSPLSVTISQTDIACSGGLTGSVTIIATGGTAPYRYSKDNGITFQSTNQFKGLSSGVYTVVVNDAHNCLSLAQSVTLSQPSALSYTVAHTDLTCNGSANGTITLTASGGTGTYQYSITNLATYQSDNRFTGLSSGTYRVSVKDTNNCAVQVQSVTVSQPALVTTSISQTNVTSCSGGGNGVIVVAAGGGKGPYQYSSDNGATFQAGNQFTSLSAGIYQVLIKDVAECLSTAQLVTITQPNALSLHVSKTDVSVAGGSNGAISVTALGGATPYQYSNDTGTTYQTSSQFINLTAGIYSVMVKDVAGCTTPAQSITIRQPTSISIATAQTNPSCYGATTGSISVTVVGGASPYQYSADNGLTYQAGNSFGNLSAGSYLIVAKDASGYVSPARRVTITQPVALSISVSQTDLTNCGATPGSITAVTSGGFAPYQYSKDNGISFQSASTFSGLTAGTYSIVSKDAAGCITPAQTLTLLQPGSLTVTVAKTDIATCFGANNGSLTATASGGAGSYRYSADNGVTYQTSAQFTGLHASSYTVVVTDADGCQSTPQSTTITQPMPLSISISQTDVGCSGSNTGSLTITASGGTGPYQYSNDNGVTFQTSNQYGNLLAGTYQVNVKDNNNCVTPVQSVTVAQPALVTAMVSQTNVTSCSSGGNGMLTVSASGGTAPYRYSKDNGVTYQTDNQFANLSAGNYQILVNDAAGCLSTVQMISITQPNALSLLVSKTNVYTVEENTGAISMTASGGTVPYQYSKDNGATFQNTNSFTGLVGGLYFVQVKDAAGCTTPTQSITITQPTGVTASISQTHLFCFGTASGSIGIAASGGIPPYQYSKDNGVTYQFGNQFTNLEAGSYPIVVKDASGYLTPVQIITLTQPVQLAGVASTTNISCFGATNGTIILTTHGGTAPYQYSIDNGDTYQTSNRLINLPAGDYKITVKDSAGCLSTVQVTTLTQPDALSVITTKSDISRYDGANGLISILVSGGRAPYQYSNDNGLSYQVANQFTNLTAGNYAVVVKDANGCTNSVQMLTLTQPTPLTVVATTTDVPCFESANGSIRLAATGGVPPYQYSSNGGNSYQTANLFPTLGAGVYSIVVKDASGYASVIQSVTLHQAAQLTVISSVSSISCFGETNGLLSVLGTGGTTPYQYSRDNGITYQSSNHFEGLAAGTYVVSIKDNAGCQATARPISLTQSAPLTITLDQTNALCSATTTGSITVVASGGTAPYQYSRDNGRSFQTDDKFSGLPAGNYQVLTKDARGCTTSAQSVTLVSGSGPTVLLSAVQPQCADDQTGTIIAQVVGGSPPYNYSWNGSDKTTSTLNNLKPGLYTFKVTDQNKCLVQDTIRIIEPRRLLQPTFGLSTTICLGDTARLDANNPNAQVQWFLNGQPFARTNQIATVTTGQYSVHITNSTGCSLSASAALSVTSQRPSPVILLSSQAKVGEVVTVLDLTLPAPDSVRWVLPIGATIAPAPPGQSASPYIQYLTFSQPGTYTIRSQITAMKVCHLTASNRIQILSPNQATFYDSTFARQVDYDPNNFIETLTIGPNPNQGNFTATVTLKDISSVTVRVQNGQGLTVFEQEQGGAKTFSFPVSINPSNGSVYYFVNVKVRYGDQNQQHVQRTVRVLIYN
jgi:hypothetical protein